MANELHRLREEAERLHTTYTMYKDSDDEVLRRRVYLQLDRFLMNHREEAIILIVQGLSKPTSFWSKFKKL